MIWSKHTHSLSLLKLALIISVGLGLLLTACSEKSDKQEAATAETVQKLLTPDEAELAAAAPETFKVKFETSKGDFVMEVHRSWSPHGADRLHYLVNNRFYEGVRFFRVIDG
ncbi:MAG: peptidylprolyl isomerase, partial [bacterium]|nr:peptidylprolyl isomerase [bacterium]